MWRLVTRLLQVVLLVSTAATLFVVGAILVSSLGGTPSRPAATEAAVEVRLTTPDGAATLFSGQPLVVDVALLTLDTRRRPDGLSDAQPRADGERAIQVDDDADPWEHRLAFEVTASDGTVFLDELPWHDRLLEQEVAPGRLLDGRPLGARFVLDGQDLAALPPGRYNIEATLPAEVMTPGDVRVTPLQLSLIPAPIGDLDRASVILAEAKVAALRGNPEAAIDAGLTALALDPLQDEALAIVAEAWEDRGDIDRAIEWYDRYLATIPDADEDRRANLEAYMDALRRQR